MKQFYMGWMLLWCSTLSSYGQSGGLLQGAWLNQQDSTTTVMIVADRYFMSATYTKQGNRFVSAMGGMLEAKGNMLEIEIEFNTRDKKDAGGFHLYDFEIAGNALTTSHHETRTQWHRIDDGRPGLLAGAWLFSGRKTNPEDEVQAYTPGARKTMKILSGTRFQWAAYNTETGEFFGTGGGTYTTQNGQYTEMLEVFSRDDNRVGSTLTFSMELNEPHWLHSGKSSKGEQVYERWSRRSSFAGQ